MQGYCVKCRAKREIVEFEEAVLTEGELAIKGLCPKCGTRISIVIMSSDEAICRTGVAKR